MPERVERPQLDVAVVGTLVVLVCLAHVVTNLFTAYEFHRDEFLYLAMGRHLRLWRMDFPPAIALIANASRALFGDTLAGIRAVPALSHGALIALAAMIAREFGGRAPAQRLAALSVALSPFFLRPGAMLQPVSFDQLWWTLALFAFLRLLNTDDPRWWLGVGVALGAGLLTKFSIAFIGLPMVLAVVLTPQRRWLATRWPWLALLLALAIGAPSLTGQLLLGFPLRDQMRALEASQLQRVTYASFLGEQLFVGPAIVLAAIGCVALLLTKRWNTQRPIAISCLGAFVLLLVLHGKSYYISPIYPTLIAAGAAWLDLRGAGAARTAGLATATLLVLGFGIVVLPLGLPILPPDTMVAYTKRLGIATVTRTNWGAQLALPQDYADMLGWHDMVAAVATVVNALPAADRNDVVLVGDNYGEAGALEFYGPRFGLPRVISTKGSYWFFGPGDRSGRVVVTLGEKKESLQRLYGDVQEVARFDHPWLVPGERDIPILVAHQPTTTVQQLWPSLAGRN